MIRFESVSIGYAGGIHAVEDVTFEAPSGKILAIIGGNGAGKTSLMRAASGSLGFQGGSVTAGSISFKGSFLHTLPAEKVVGRGVALVPEGRQVFTALTVEENLQAGAATVASAETRARRIAHAYEMFQVLGTRRHQAASLLSGGEQQMLAIARGLMSGPEVLLLDEPTLGLAPKIVVQISEVLANINQDGTTVIVVEQNAGMALGIADEAIVLERGRVSMHGTASELRQSDKVKALYLGGSTDENEEELQSSAPSLGRWEQ